MQLQASIIHWLPVTSTILHVVNKVQRLIECQFAWIAIRECFRPDPFFMYIKCTRWHVIFVIDTEPKLSKQKTTIYWLSKCKEKMEKPNHLLVRFYSLLFVGPPSGLFFHCDEEVVKFPKSKLIFQIKLKRLTFTFQSGQYVCCKRINKKLEWNNVVEIWIERGQITDSSHVIFVSDW